MRADMRKVLCERPRAHSQWSYHDVRAKQRGGDYEDMPAYQGMRRPYGYETKEFSDLLGPLKRFMRGCVGRRYDDVWSELCAHVPADTVSGNHLRDHARWECDTNTCVADDKVYVREGRFRSSGEPRGLYVDPRDGLIYHNDNRRAYHRYVAPVMVDGLAYRQRDGLLYPYHGWTRAGKSGKYPLKVIGDRRAMLIDGHWYWMILQDVPAAISVPYVVDGVTKIRVVEHPRYDLALGDYVKAGRYHADKRQMASRDLRRHGLRNV